ncbi:MAG: SAM-dependent methyltransferase [Lachnospiraceae bacterium]|nr:SAM-dependent methyltransferase [Candidatus Equihabitans merdae]
MVKLSGRLQTIADMIDPCGAVTDVGCDHALLSIYLLEQGKVDFALGSDLREGPLKMAEANKERAGFTDQLSLVKWDGVPASPPDGALVIAGMGGMLMARILNDAADRLHHFSQIILEPQSDLDVLRKAVASLGFFISDEEMVIDEGKYYAVIKAQPGTQEPLTDKEWLYGPFLIRKRNEALKGYLLAQGALREKLIDTLEASQSENSRIKCAQVRQEKELIQEVLSLYEES